MQRIGIFPTAGTTFSAGMGRSEEVFLSSGSDICIAKSIPSTARSRASRKYIRSPLEYRIARETSPLDPILLAVPAVRRFHRAR